MSIQILPAIDLKGGQCVRLRQGKAEDVTVYSSDPVDMALHWEREGGDYLHVVDLDGAFQGRPIHGEIIGRIAQALTIPFEVGGGLRTDADIDYVLGLGADRVILGTRACDSPETLEALVRRFGERLVVGIDARDGMVQVKGWTETTGLRATDLATHMSAMGVKTIIYTDTARDGMLHGVNTEAMAAMCDAVGGSPGGFALPAPGGAGPAEPKNRMGSQIIASGGVSSVNDMHALAALNRANLSGAIVGKALYEGRVTVQEMKSAG